MDSLLGRIDPQDSSHQPSQGFCEELHPVPFHKLWMSLDNTGFIHILKKKPHHRSIHRRRRSFTELDKVKDASQPSDTVIVFRVAQMSKNISRKERDRLLPATAPSVIHGHGTNGFDTDSTHFRQADSLLSSFGTDYVPPENILNCAGFTPACIGIFFAQWPYGSIVLTVHASTLSRSALAIISISPIPLPRGLFHAVQDDSHDLGPLKGLQGLGQIVRTIPTCLENNKHTITMRR